MITESSFNFVHKKIFTGAKFQTAVRYTKIAKALSSLEQNKKAFRYGNYAIKLVPLYNAPWLLQEKILMKDGNEKKILAFKKKKSKVFKKYKRAIASPKMIEELFKRMKQHL